jgi:hypothetical protein
LKSFPQKKCDGKFIFEKSLQTAQSREKFVSPAEIKQKFQGKNCVFFGNFRDFFYGGIPVGLLMKCFAWNVLFCS